MPTDNCRISLGSVWEAHTHIQWMGKDWRGTAWFVTSSPEYTAGMVAMWVS